MDKRKLFSLRLSVRFIYYSCFVGSMSRDINTVEEILSLRRVYNYNKMLAKEQEDFDRLTEQYIALKSEVNRLNNKAKYMEEWEEFDKAIDCYERASLQNNEALAILKTLMEKYDTYKEIDDLSSSTQLISLVKKYFNFDEMGEDVKEKLTLMSSLLEI